MDVLQTALKYLLLYNSAIEKIDVFANKFSSFFYDITSKDYDPLNHRKPYFDSDYEQYKKNVAETIVELRNFFYSCVSETPNIAEALRVVARYYLLYHFRVTFIQHNIQSVRFTQISEIEV